MRGEDELLFTTSRLQMFGVLEVLIERNIRENL